MTFAALPARKSPGGAARVLIVPGLCNSGPAHWQTWLQAQYPDAVRLLVAPADPRKFAVEHRLPLRPLGLPSTLIASETDPWMRWENAGAWALLWASRFVNLGAVGHINTESGFGPFPLAREIVDRMRHVTPPEFNLSAARPIPRAHTDLRFAI